jgi:metal-sulfur cluster biosynthetic enzyme
MDEARSQDQGPNIEPDGLSATVAEAPAATTATATADPADGPLTRERVLESLKSVFDPELGINIVDLGLVYEVEISDGTVHIEYTLTTMGCPIGPLIEQQMQQLLSSVDGVETVDAEMVIRPAWSPEMMSEEAKAALGYF